MSDRSTPPRGAGLRRMGWTAIDQALLSVINFGLGVAVARAAPPRDFGAFAISLTVFFVVLGVVRSLASDPLTVRFSTAGHAQWREAVAQAAGTSLVVAVVAGFVVSAAAVVMGGVLGAALLVLGLSLPGLLLQDLWRFALFAGGRPARAACNEAFAALVVAGGIAVLVVAGSSEPWHYLAAWGVAAGAAAVLGGLQVGVAPDPSRARAWMARHRRLSLTFLGEVAVSSGAVHAVSLAVAAIVGYEGAAALRGAQTIFGPVNMAFLTLLAIGVPEGARVLAVGSRQLVRAMVVLSACAVVVAATWGATTALALPIGVGTAVLGETWPLAVGVLPAYTLLMAAVGMSQGPSTGLRVLERPGRSLAIRLFVAPFTLVGGILGAAVGGADLATWGMAVPLAVAALLWWRQFTRHAARHQPREPAGGDPVLALSGGPHRSAPGRI